MNHMNEIMLLLDSIITCGESMAKIGRLLKEFIPEFVDAVPKKEKQTIEAEPVPAELPEKAEQPIFTFADVRKAFSAKSHAGYTTQVKQLISKYGADRLSDVQEKDYAALMADLEAVE